MISSERNLVTSPCETGKDAAVLSRALRWGGCLLLGGTTSGLFILARSLLHVPDPATVSIFELNSFSKMTETQMIQDIPAAALSALLLLLISWRLKYLRELTPSFPTKPVIAIVSTLVLVIAYLGFVTIHRRYPLSADEFWALFDAAVFREGHLLARLAPEWQEYASALQPVFRLEVPGNLYLISSYLPMNAAIQALLGTVVPHGMGVAILASIAVIALFGVARNIWPNRPDAAVVAVILMASSPQFLVTAMTPFAMTAHLALNLVWLWLFLKQTVPTHVLAIGIAFIASGLHQVVFHPLFAAPFVLSLWLSRRYRIAILHTAAYAAIGIFWVLYWKLAFMIVGDIPNQTGASFGLSSFVTRVLDLIELDAASFGAMLRNILRFIAWQNPMAVALVVASIILSRTWREPIPSLALGIIFTLATLLVLMPYAAHSWGYRYVHGLLGSISLIAVHGWVQVTRLPQRTNTWRALSVCTLFTLGVLLPTHAFQVERVVGPRAEASRIIESTSAEVVIVDGRGIQFGWDLARNDPFLQRTPKVLLLESLDEPQLRRLCADYNSIAIFDHNDAQAVGIRTGRVEDQSYYPENTTKRLLMQTLGCGMPIRYSAT